DLLGHADVLSETAEAFNAAATWIARVCWDEEITNSNTAHHRVYGETRRRFGLGAQLAVCARAKAMEACRAERKKDGATCPVFDAQSSVRYDARTYRFVALDGISLHTLHGRVTCRMRPAARQRAMPLEDGWDSGAGELVPHDAT